MRDAVRTAHTVIKFLTGSLVARARSDPTVPDDELVEWRRLLAVLEHTAHEDESARGLADDLHWRVWRWCVVEGKHIDVSPPPTLSSSSPRGFVERIAC